jgi:murein DD-endopeptidase MepM/ murein hydrolase activator NlpD
LFKNYHIVIFKDREGGFSNLRMRGWLGVLLCLLLAALAGLNIYLWNFHTRSVVLEHELEEARKLIQSQDSQMLSLAGKVQSLEEDILRVQQFDSKLRVLMNIDKDTGEDDDQGDDDLSVQNEGHAAAFRNPTFLSRHRDLFNRRMHSLVQDLIDNVNLEEIDQQTLVGFLRANKDSLLSTPSIWPVKGYLTSGFGRRKAPMAGASRMHKGLDISNRVGTPIRAPARGAVTFAGMDGAYGISVTIDHGNGIITHYAHMQRASVTVGQYVQRGDVIGALGNTGRSTGPHLHYEVRVNGMPVNPMRYILN